MSFTRQQVVSIARSFNGIKYLHQGRGEKGLDCVGLICRLADEIYYPYTDLEGYKRTPSSTELLRLLNESLDEIDLSEVREGDIYAMRLGGVKIRHTAIKTSEDTLIHALNTISIQRVIEQPIELYRGQIVKGFRLRGIVD